MAQRSRVQEWKEEDLWLSNLSSVVHLLLLASKLILTTTTSNVQKNCCILLLIVNYAFLHINIYTLFSKFDCSRTLE